MKNGSMEYKKEPGTDSIQEMKQKLAEFHEGISKFPPIREIVPPLQNKMENSILPVTCRYFGL